MPLPSTLRRTGALVAALLPLAAAVHAQRVEFTPYAAYKVFGESGRIRIDDGEAFGGFVQVRDRRLPVGLEFLYSRQSTDLRVPRIPGLNLPSSIGLSVEHFAVSGVRDFGRREATTSPYTTFGLGWTTYASAGYGSRSRFLVTVGAGLRQQLTPMLGLHLGARGYMTITDSGSGFGCNVGTGGGSGCSIGFGGSGIFQAEFLAGATIAFAPRRGAR